VFKGAATNVFFFLSRISICITFNLKPLNLTVPLQLVGCTYGETELCKEC